MNPIHHFTTIRSPFGPFSFSVDAKGRLSGAAFGGKSALARRLGGASLVPAVRQTAAARRELEAWFAGRRRAFSLRLAPAPTAFQERLRLALKRLPAGRTVSYGELAKRMRSSARAVGRANATNPICVVVPCHRVIGADGSLTGYAFGTRRKKGLLDLEKR
jgi:methylated-DNA-[protein]-cysteine S-methyltransferase